MRLTPEQRKRLLIDAGFNLAVEHGLYNFSTEQVAQSAECSRPLVNHHFGSLIGLRRAVIEYALANLDQVENAPNIAAQAVVMKDTAVEYLSHLEKNDILIAGSY